MLHGRDSAQHYRRQVSCRPSTLHQPGQVRSSLPSRGRDALLQCQRHKGKGYSPPGRKVAVWLHTWLRPDTYSWRTEVATSYKKKGKTKCNKILLEGARPQDRKPRARYLITCGFACHPQLDSKPSPPTATARVAVAGHCSHILRHATKSIRNPLLPTFYNVPQCQTFLSIRGRRPRPLLFRNSRRWNQGKPFVRFPRAWFRFKNQPRSFI